MLCIRGEMPQTLNPGLSKKIILTVDIKIYVLVSSYIRRY